VVTVWDLVKWPVPLLLISFMFALLYWASPNAKQGFRWVTPGGILAVVVWVVASVAFAVNVANFGSYNKTLLARRQPLLGTLGILSSSSGRVHAVPEGKGHLHKDSVTGAEHDASSLVGTRRTRAQAGRSPVIRSAPRPAA
jgi:hypothetical protein